MSGASGVGIAGLAVVGMAALIYKQQFVIFEYQWGLLYYKGQFQKILPAGLHSFYRRHYICYIFDKRPKQITVVGQEVLAKDGIGLKLSFYVEYIIDDPKQLFQQASITNIVGLENFLYSLIQLPIREAVGCHTLEELVGNRDTITNEVSTALGKSFAALGLSIRTLGIRDLMLSKEIKDAFDGELLAKKQAAVLLESTRAETAALRSLANSARLLRDNPEIMKLRVLQSMQSNNGGKNTIVVDFSDQKNSAATDEKLA
jgi:regulator of protease activity HflC (stomatin/prohibitin superfamily)